MRAFAALYEQYSGEEEKSSRIQGLADDSRAPERPERYPGARQRNPQSTLGTRGAHRVLQHNPIIKIHIFILKD